MVGMASVAARNLDELAERVRPVALRSDQRGFPVLPWLEPLLPAGLPRGAVVSVGAAPGVAGATTLALALAAGASQEGAWVALVGDVAPGGAWGLVAAAELGLAFERLVVVAPPEPPAGGWGPVIAALVEGFPLVVLGQQVRLRAGDTRRLSPRLRERGGTLIRITADGGLSSAQVRLTVTGATWEGLSPPPPSPLRQGYLHARRFLVEATGRGSASRPRHTEIPFPAPRAVASPAGGG
jgi:hypothetical protein